MLSPQGVWSCLVYCLWNSKTYLKHLFAANGRLFSKSKTAYCCCRVCRYCLNGGRCWRPIGTLCCVPGAFCVRSSGDFSITYTSRSPQCPGLVWGPCCAASSEPLSRLSKQTMHRQVLRRAVLSAMELDCLQVTDRPILIPRSCIGYPVMSITLDCRPKDGRRNLEDAHAISSLRLPQHLAGCLEAQ